MKWCSPKHFAVLSLLASLPGFAGEAQLRPVVLELFSSQGCSSCPPADALLGELAARPNVIALAFHVDYWDNIGWRDRFEISDAAPRQRRYVETLNLSTAFTPQAVIDGRLSYVGSDRRRLFAALAATPNGVPVALRVADGELQVSIGETIDRGGYDVNLIAYLPQASTAVGRGENSGRTLVEFNIVRQFRRLGTWAGRESRFQVPLASFPPDASRVAVLIQREDQGVIDGAAAAALR